MSYYCCDCGKDITSWAFKHYVDQQPERWDKLMCASCYKKDEQLNKGKGED